MREVSASEKEHADGKYLQGDVWMIARTRTRCVCVCVWLCAQFSLVRRLHLIRALFARWFRRLASGKFMRERYCTESNMIIIFIVSVSPAIRFVRPASGRPLHKMCRIVYISIGKMRTNLLQRMKMRAHTSAVRDINCVPRDFMLPQRQPAQLTMPERRRKRIVAMASRGNMNQTKGKPT